MINILCRASFGYYYRIPEFTRIDGNKNTELIKTGSIQKYEKQQFDDVIITTAAGVHFSSQFRDDSAHFRELFLHFDVHHNIICIIILTKYIIIVVD